jgi:hypothetical protein
MNSTSWKNLVGAIVLVSAGLVLTACNTTKATVDTFAKFTSSTSPEEWINGDGVIEERHKARLFAAVAFENLEQDIARGQGEYLTSLAVLLHVPAGGREEFLARAQRTYPLLVGADQQTAEHLLAVLTSNGPRQE